MRTLIYCCSVYQLFNAIHIKYHMLQADDVDLMLSDNFANRATIAENLRKTGLFGTVFEVNSKAIGDQKYRHTRWTVYGYRICPRSILKQAQVPELREKYDRYYFATFNDFIGFLYLDLRRRNKKLECCCYEDGGVTYMRTYQAVNPVEERLYRWLRIKPLGKETVPLLVYDPELMTFDCGAKVWSMPKIRKDDTEFVRHVNTVFGTGTIDPPEQDVIFFEEAFLAAGLKNNDQELIELCAKTCGNSMVLKPHPQNPYNRFEDSGISILRSSVPWEVYCLNCDLSGKLLVTVNSNAAISPHILFEEAPKSVLLYNLLIGESNLRGKPEYDLYYQKLLQKYPGQIMAPKDKTELIGILEPQKSE